MNILDSFGPTLTLQELCILLKCGRSSYYNYINPKHKRYIPGIPKRLPEYGNNKFCSLTVQNYLKKRSELTLG